MSIPTEGIQPPSVSEPKLPPEELGPRIGDLMDRFMGVIELIPEFQKAVAHAYMHPAILNGNNPIRFTKGLTEYIVKHIAKRNEHGSSEEIEITKKKLNFRGNDYVIVNLKLATDELVDSDKPIENDGRFHIGTRIINNEGTNINIRFNPYKEAKDENINSSFQIAEELLQELASIL